ncbi:hypothetical protein LPJ66_001469 [Kickxella alabastrina]|uniref:Uncharacterized protein n=1 Tax=Kickxella alabastrina TaxID=61397 RepID=A0ACC1IT56_9FUNG|nr:hypothetical protein LPJ66_001469 [Kickxella alabastrina]
MTSATQADSAPQKSTGILQDVVNSIFEPGVNRGVLVVMNCAFAGLFLILFYLVIATRFNIHVCALTVIAGLLFASIQWFIKELSASRANSPTSKDKKSDDKLVSKSKASSVKKNKHKKL